MSNRPANDITFQAFGWRVLAIDDDPLFLEVVQVRLERTGCTVEVAVRPTCWAEPGD